VDVLERYEVEAFLTLAEELHFGRTAERLHVSTAGISQAIRKLERRVGVPLFYRTSRRVTLSVVGRQLHDDLRPAWDQVTAAVERAVDVGRGLTGTLRAAFTDAAAGQLLVGAAELFHDRQPDCQVEIREAQPAEVLTWLRAATVDIAVAAFPVSEPDIVAGPVLVTEAAMLAVPSTSPLATRAHLSVADLTDVPMVRVAGAPVVPVGGAGAPGPTAATVNEMLTLVGAGRGCSPVGAHTRRYYARPDVAFVVLPDVPPLQWGLLWSSGGDTARVRAFAAAARELVGGSGRPP
jgi:DNA-binding transcriptional LysR family regulator